MDGGIYQCKPFYRRFQEKVWGYARGNITITMYLGNRLLRWLVIFFYFIINYAGKQNQFVLYYIMRTCFFTHHMHLFAIVNWVACSSLMGYLVHRYIVSISVRQRIRPTTPEAILSMPTILPTRWRGIRKLRSRLQRVILKPWADTIRIG